MQIYYIHFISKEIKILFIPIQMNHSKKDRKA